jgi:hypothetical protein
VADELEAHWNRALQQIVDAQAIYERQRDADRVAVDADTRARILALATTSRGSGTIRPRPIANGNAWSACSWKMLL